MSWIVFLAETWVLFLGLCSCIGLAYLGFVGLLGGSPQGVVALSEYDAVSTVLCGSKSMGLVVGCNDRVLLREIPVGSNLTEGRIYTYDGSGESVIHRYLGCQDAACHLLIFHGDANPVAEIVHRDNVTYEVVGVYYE